MAAKQVARVQSAAGNLCFRYQLFFFVILFLLMTQMLIAFNFWSYHQEETKKLDLWKRRVEQLEQVHENWEDLLKDNKGPSSNGNGDGGAAHGANVIWHPKLQPVAERPTTPPSNLSKTAPEQAPLWMRPRKKNKRNDVVEMQQNHEMLVQKLNETYGGDWKGPQCELKEKEALYALLRATSTTCKKEIAEVACGVQKGTIFPKTLPRACPLQDDTYMKYVGCFADDRDKRLLTGHDTNFKEENSKEFCVNYCLRIGFEYAGMQFNYECWCGDKIALVRKTEESRCDSRCPGNSNQTCGGFLMMNVYHTGLGGRPYTTASYVRPDLLVSKSQPSRIAFVLTLNGRALRQIRRLFKAIYHTNHYYYIHVDKRQEYLHRELSELASNYENVRVAPWQMSTIWGGASLLEMHLRCIQDLLAMTDWTWDYFVNLSESDFPIKPLEDLVAFLTKYKGKNFVRTHGRDTAKFIQKQALDRTFVECDTHMWRIGMRSLPDGIRVDGGSDWVGLHRRFCDYLVNTQDELYRGLTSIWKYTLLPSESFFHTMLMNSRFCESMVNNNLHHTNWVRNQGCKCQYKHIVDWCGCSPNDYKPSDVAKLLGHEGRPVYFGRKFEAIISNQVVNEMEDYISGSYPDDTPGLLSYWQSEYHHEDTLTKVDDAFLTFYETFSQLGTEKVKTALKGQGCSFLPTKVLEASIYAYADNIQGLLVRYTAQNFLDKSEQTLETFVQPQKKFTIMRPMGPISRLKTLEVSTQFDPKEEVFRNFGSLLGPYSTPVLAHSWGEGQAFTATFVWIDPSYSVAASFDIPIKPEENIAVHEPTFEHPLRPGLWTVRLLYLWETAAEFQFLVTPLLYYGGRLISDGDAQRIHVGPDTTYVDRDFKDIKDVLQLTSVDLIQKEAGKNARRTGADLESWVQDVTCKFWHVSDTCIDQSSYAACPRLPSCQQTQWSSLSPDPKSELTPVTPNGRIR